MPDIPRFAPFTMQFSKFKTALKCPGKAQSGLDLLHFIVKFKNLGHHLAALG